MFHEFEYEAGQREGVKLPPRPVTIAKPDPVREVFYDMRSLAGDNPGTWNDGKLFYRQGRFMEDFADEYEGADELFRCAGRYQRMGYDDLRSYFTFRSRVRRGETPPAYLAGLMLYVYELLNGIGVASSQEGLDRLMDFWGRYGLAKNPAAGRVSALDRCMLQWLLDYHIYYPLPRSFEAFVGEVGLEAYYAGVFLYDLDKTSLEAWEGFSSYRASQSKFCAAGHQQVMGDCFLWVLGELQQTCVKNGAALRDLFACKAGSHRWRPFSSGERCFYSPKGGVAAENCSFAGAPFHHWYSQPNRQTTLPNGDTYTYDGGQWTATTRTDYRFRRDLIGFIIKHTESCLRAETGFKAKLTANKKPLLDAHSTLSQTGVSYHEIITAIENAVKNYHRDLHKIEVSINAKSLTRIRQESDSTQQKLTPGGEQPHGNLDEDVVNASRPERDSRAGIVLPAAQNHLPSKVEEANQKPEDGLRPELPSTQAPHIYNTEDASFAPDGLSPEPRATQPSFVTQTLPPSEVEEANPLTNETTPWQQLKSALTPIETEALTQSIKSPGGFTAFAQANGIMPEVLADSINEKAVDIIGDSILDDELAIYEDYIAIIQ